MFKGSNGLRRVDFLKSEVYTKVKLHLLSVTFDEGKFIAFMFFQNYDTQNVKNR